MSTWGWSDRGKKAHAFDANGRAICGMGIMVEEAPNATAAERCANCKKKASVYDAAEARDAARGGPRPVVSRFAAVPPGGLECPSTVHQPGPPVRANWEGVFISAALQESAPAAYCDWCAHLLVTLKMFVIDEDPPICVRCVSAFAVPKHSPCCDATAPHGRPLCCSCYGITHHVQGTPCH